ncbi:MAG: hypothetical protein KME41_05815 [Candidatus Thiodiazotropha sp. (ex Lucina pensylvanica)]|nr:hypothetical protein [Candidatus Thiodiazotropha sp. (ex Lucina pensylvanica)]
MDVDIKKIISALPFLLTAFNCEAGTALCEIKVLDIQTGAKQAIEQEFELSGEPQRKHFYLPDSGYRCTLVFFDLDSGTALVCELDKRGHDYIQSDRSTAKEHQPVNNLTFRIGNSHYTLKSSCK